MATGTHAGDSPDGELLRHVGEGNVDAFEEFYGRHALWLSTRLQRRCGDPDLVAELLQEVFVAVWRTAASYSGDAHAGPWLWSIASRRLIDNYRRQAVRSRILTKPPESLAPLADAGDSPSAEEEALAGTYSDRLAVALDRLSPELREVLQATVIDGLSIRETAVLLGLPEGTVKSRAGRARQQLREALT